MLNLSGHAAQSGAEHSDFLCFCVNWLLHLKRHPVNYTLLDPVDVFCIFAENNSVRETFTNKLITALESVVCGDPLDPAVQVGPVINEEAAKKIEEQVNRIIEQGGRLLLGGKRNGTFFEITVLTDVPPTSDVAKDEEIFGPVIPIIGFDTTQEAISIANASSYGLNSCVFSSNASEAMTVAYAMQAGTAVINGSGLFRSNEMPFGGHKRSGLGTEGTLTSLEECSQLKTILYFD